MNISAPIRYRTLFILVATFFVLCLSPLADIHLEGGTEERSYTHGEVHNELLISLFIHELLFSHLQHTFDHITLGTSHHILQKNEKLSSKGNAFPSNTQTILTSNTQTPAVYLLTPDTFLQKNKQTAGIYSRELSGLSPPKILS